MNRALTDLEFMAYEAVLYLRFLSEDYPFLTARRPKLEEWLRQLRTDGPGSEGKRSCQVPEQALKLLEEAERELEESDSREQAELLKKYPLPFPEDKGIDRDSLLLAADRALEQETAGLEALFPSLWAGMKPPKKRSGGPDRSALRSCGKAFRQIVTA